MKIKENIKLVFNSHSLFSARSHVSNTSFVASFVLNYQNDLFLWRLSCYILRPSTHFKKTDSKVQESVTLVGYIVMEAVAE